MELSFLLCAKGFMSVKSFNLHQTPSWEMEWRQYSFCSFFAWLALISLSCSKYFLGIYLFPIVYNHCKSVSQSVMLGRLDSLSRNLETWQSNSRLEGKLVGSIHYSNGVWEDYEGFLPLEPSLPWQSCFLSFYNPGFTAIPYILRISSILFQ